MFHKKNAIIELPVGDKTAEPLLLTNKDGQKTDDTKTNDKRKDNNLKVPDKISSTVVLPLQEDENIMLTYDAPPGGERANWGGKLEFFLASVSYAVGLGNVWRFPYLCYANGGGAFLIPYVIMLAVVGLPLFFLEFAFGQFASLGPISVWNISPLFKGIGYAMVAISWIMSIYYNVINAHSLFFLACSLTSKLPWSDCNNSWNDNATCIDFTNTSNMTIRPSSDVLTSPSEDFYTNFVLQQTDGIHNFGLPSWKLTICLFILWFICAIVLIKGVQSLGKVSYFTAVFPYLMLTILLIRGFFLPGSMKGIIYYLNPQFHRLMDPNVWSTAATQIFFSLGCCSGSLIAMSSFNKFKNNCFRDAIIVACINCATSIYAGFVVFANLGFMSEIKNVTIDKVAKGGPGLAFVVYPEALTKMPLPIFWSIFFFIMLVTLGLGSQFTMVETVLSGLEDELRRLGFNLTATLRMSFRVGLCALNFLLGIPMLCGGGYYLLALLDHLMATYPLLIVGFTEICVICYAYGLKQFRRDIELMISFRPNWYWRVNWLFITPAITLLLIIFVFFKADYPDAEKYTYPTWAKVLGHLTASFPPICIPVWFLYKYCAEGGLILFREFLKPVQEWGPAKDEHRAEFISMIRSTESLKRSGGSAVFCTGAFLPGGLTEADAAFASAAALNSVAFGLGGSTASGLAGLADDTGFFQSKLSVAEKLTEKHTKEMVKRATADPTLSSLDALTASQTALAALATNKVIQPHSAVYTGLGESGASSNSLQPSSSTSKLDHTHTVVSVLPRPDGESVNPNNTDDEAVADLCNVNNAVTRRRISESASLDDVEKTLTAMPKF